MQGLKELYKTGPGPSSSHTLAPQRACRLFLERYGDLMSFDVELFGSLALTGVGHATDAIIKNTFAPKMCRISFNRDRKEAFPNGLIIRGLDEHNRPVVTWTVYSLGGGSIEVEEEDLHLNDEVYPENTMDEILDYCQRTNTSLKEYPFLKEEGLYEYLDSILSQMLKTVQNGLNTTGLLPGSLKMERVAKALYFNALSKEGAEKERMCLMAYAYAACEENGAGGICTTAPTMGAGGIVAALMYHYYFNRGISRSELIRALAVGGLFGNVIKTNASISGAVAGCQAEVGTACAMGSAMVAYLQGLSDSLIAYAAEIGMEHNLGLTCDPVEGYVMIPCIERNVTNVLRCFDNAMIAASVGSMKGHKVSFDEVVRTMKYTGMKLAPELRETSLGGLAAEVDLFKDESKPEQNAFYEETAESKDREIEISAEKKTETSDATAEEEEIVLPETEKEEETPALEPQSAAETETAEKEITEEAVSDTETEETGYYPDEIYEQDLYEAERNEAKEEEGMETPPDPIEEEQEEAEAEEKEKTLEKTRLSLDDFDLDLLNNFNMNRFKHEDVDKKDILDEILEDKKA